MTNKTEMVSVPRELLEKIEKSWRVPDGCPTAIWDDVNIIIRTGLEELRELLAAPAEDVRAVGEDPVYQVRSHGSCCWEDIGGESLEVCRSQPEEYEIRTLYHHPQRPVAPQCSEVTSKCSEHLRTQAKLFPNSVVYPHPPRHTDFLLPEREEPGYTLEQMQAYLVDCIKAFIKQNK